MRHRTPSRPWLALTISAALLLGAGAPAADAAPPSGPIPSARTGQSDTSGPTLARTAEGTGKAEQASTEPDTDRILVDFADGVDDATKQRVIAKTDAASQPLRDAKEIKETATGQTVVASAEKLTPTEQKSVVRDLQADPAVVSAEPDTIVHRATAAWQDNPSDSYFSSQWNLRDIDVPAAWKLATGKNVTIGITDTGITSHPEFSGKTGTGYDFVSGDYDRDGTGGRDGDPTDPGVLNSSENWHGTHVAGIAAAKTNNGLGIAGVAPDARISMARSLGTGASGYQSDIADSIVWLSGGTVPGVPRNPNPSGVINASISWPSGTCPQIMKNAIDSAHARNVPVVVAAGNTGTNADHATPSNCLGAIVVGATTTNDIITGYSNWGSMLDIMAPGGAVGAGQVFSTWNNGWSQPGAASYRYMNGTSMAAPHITGVIALMKERNPSLSVEQIRSILYSTGTYNAGYRTVDARAAVAAVTPQYRLEGNIKRFYDANGGAARFGAPTMNELSITNGGRTQNYANGYGIYWTQRTGAHSLRWGSAIPNAFAAAGWENGWGYPDSEEASAGAGARYQSFDKWFDDGKKPIAFWKSDTGTFMVERRYSIGKYWTSHGAQSGLGMPVSQEKRIGDTGAYQFYRSLDGQWKSTLVMWTPQRGAHAIKQYGAIGAAWVAGGRENGTYGWPVSDEYRSGNTMRQDFSKGWSLEYDLTTHVTRAVRS
ncbi:S8 family serine peptidase [Rothia kristinae]|uniref:S8 family serine peptidase n=1 Tax=Rothia kristinae TaxID=37923 RepID=UPI0011A469D5|nr:S8 family serine peptidase [Rothia kristinae]